MELLQCVIGPSAKRRSRHDDVYAARAVQSADRDLERRSRRQYGQEHGQWQGREQGREHVRESVPLERVRRQSLPASATLPASQVSAAAHSERVSATLPHQSAPRRRVDSSSSGSTVARTTARAAQRMHHWGSSLSLASENSVSELTSRTLLPPPSPAQRRTSTPTRAGTPTRQPKPALPQMRVEVQSPSLADYLAKPRLVRNTPPTLARPSHYHAKRLLAGAEHGLRPNYRNLRLGNFMEGENVSEGELIPEMLRQYYLDTFLGSCDTCESATHVNPTSPIQRGM